VILALFRSEVLLVEIFVVDSDLLISRLFLVKEFFGIDPPQDLFAGDVHVAIFHLLECFLVVLAQILLAESFDGPECLAGPAALFLDLFLAFMSLLLIVSCNVLLAICFQISLLATCLRSALLVIVVIIIFENSIIFLLLHCVLHSLLAHLFI